MILIGKPKARTHVNPVTQVHSQYKCSKTWLGDTVMCSCVFPQIAMRKGFFGWHCVNTNCRDFLSNSDARFIERVKLDTDSVNRFINRRHSSRLIDRIKRADKTGEYIQAFEKD